MDLNACGTPLSKIKDALNEYLNEATERIIREEVYGDSAEAPERVG